MPFYGFFPLMTFSEIQGKGLIKFIPPPRQGYKISLEKYHF